MLAGREPGRVALLDTTHETPDVTANHVMTWARMWLSDYSESVQSMNGFDNGEDVAAARTWPLVTDLVRGELRAYLATACSAEVQSLPTCCMPWTVRDLTTHLAVTFRRFADMLERSRAGDLTPPFGCEELSAINLREVERFTGDPYRELEVQVERFLSLVHDPDERMAHQRGPIPVSLQVLFGLNELALHRHDVEEARGREERPDDAVLAVLLPVWEEVLGGVPSGEDRWQQILAASGR